MPTLHSGPVCRLFVLLARDAPLGVVFRQGPRQLTQLLLWHTNTDTFEPGDRIVGHLSPERGDLSPDGKLLIYVAANYTMGHHNKGLPPHWTALSRPPYLTPLALWPNDEPYYLGGLFTAHGAIEINLAPYALEDWREHKPSFPAGAPPAGFVFEYENLPWTPSNQLFTRLMRSGWSQVPARQQSETVDIAFVKAHPTKPLSLVLGRGSGNSQTYTVHHEAGNAKTKLVGAVWADWDQRGRLVYSLDGKLFTAELDFPGKLQPSEIADFTTTARRRPPTPESASQW